MFEKTKEDNFDVDTKSELKLMAQNYMEDARKFHEEYLIKGKKSDLDNAVDYYIDAIKFNPNIAEAYYRLATLLWDKGEININSAIEQCKSAINISPDNSNARNYAGFFLELDKRYDEAEIQFKEAIKLNPLKSARSRFSLASLYIDKMHNTKVNPKDLYQYFYYVFSGSLSLPLDTGSVKMLFRNISKNISVMFFDFVGNLLEKTKNYSMAVKTYDMAAQTIGRDSVYYNKIGDISIKKEDVKDARISYIKALETNPYNRELLYKVATLSQVYFEDEIDIAIDCYTKLLEIEQDTAGIYYELGHLYMKKHDVINSINAFKLALNKDSDNPFYHNALAYALCQAEQYDDACEHYKFAIDSNPDNEWTAIVCQSLASIYYNIYNDSDSALDILKTAIMLDGTNDEVYVDIGDIYQKAEEPDSAIKAYCEAIKLNPANPVTYNKCALSLWQKDYLEEAIIAYNKAINLNPDYSNAYNNLGVIYLDGIRNLKEAKKLFKTAISLNSNYTMAHFNMGRVCDELGDKVLAAKYYQKALELNELYPELESNEISENLYKLFEV